MARHPARPVTPDLFDWVPADPVQRFDEREVRAQSLVGRIAKGVAATLKADGRQRSEIAGAMAEWLGRPLSKAMLDAYASEAREEHAISVARLAALIAVTGDVRLLQLLAEQTGHAVVEARYLPWIEIGQIADRKAELERMYDAAKRNARRGRA